MTATEQPAASSKLAEASELLDEVVDLLNALDLIGDAIGDQKGYAISAVALAARTAAHGALDIVHRYRN